MAKKVIYECDCCPKTSEHPMVRICLQLYSREKGYPAYVTEDKWDVCSECGQKINAFILGLREENKNE